MLTYREMTKIAPIIEDKFYVTEKFQEKDSMGSLASDASKSNMDMGSIKDAMSTGNSHMSVD